MGVVRWIITAVVFLGLLFVALQNSQPVTVTLLSFYTWEAPLVFVILIAFAAGVALGLLSAAIKVARLKRQVSRAHREHAAATRGASPRPAPAPAPELPSRLPGE